MSVPTPGERARQPSGRPSAPPLPHPPSTSDAAQWGRVDESGNVFVRTATGEHKVGEWLAGDPQDGLTFYERRYRTLAVDVDLLEHRLTDAGLAADEAMAKIGKLRSQVDEPTCVGDLDALSKRLDALVALVDQRKQSKEADRAAARAKARESREALVAEAEKLSTSTQWKSTGDRYRAIVEEWKHLPHIDRPAEQEMWKRLSHSRTAFEKRRRVWFAERESKRDEAQQAKEKLVREAAALADSKDWGPTSTKFRTLMSKWKAAGQAPRGTEQELWAKFKESQDTFFTARSAAFAERDAGLSENLQAKKALLEEAERLVPVKDPPKARAALRAIQDKWAAVGHVPRGDKDAVEKRLLAVEQAVREAEDARWKRTNPEAQARAQATVDQLTKSIAKLEKELAKAEASGNQGAIAKAKEAIAARQEWMEQAKQSLAEFSGASS